MIIAASEIHYHTKKNLELHSCAAYGLWNVHINLNVFLVMTNEVRV